MYQQILDPLFNSLGWSALAASLPLVVLFALLGIVRMTAWKASLAALVVALAVAVFIYPMPVDQAALSALLGAAFGFFPILWIVINAIWIYNMTVTTGHFSVLQRSFSRVSEDRRIQAVIIAFCFGALLEAPLELDDGLRRRWLDWLADSAASALPPLDEALRRLGWQAAGLTAMGNALRGLLAGEQAPAALLLDPWLAPQAVAARLPDGREALARLLEALPTPAAGERLRVAVLDTRAGLWLDQGMASLLRPGLELTLFERSRVLLDAAATRLPERIAVQALDDGLLPAEHLGRYDRVISFAALHTYAASCEGLALAAALLRPQGRLLLVDLLCESSLALLGAALLDDRPLRLAELPSLLADLAAAGLAPRCLWRSERIALVEALAPGLGLDAAALQAGLEQRLPQAMRPERLWCLPSLPLNGNGKVDRRRLAESMTRALGECRHEPSAEEPLEAHEQALAECWEAVLKRPVRRREASFFSLGGDSLLATRLLAGIRERFGVRLGMADFYRQPTLAGLARHLQAQTVEIEETQLEEGVL